MAVSDVFPALRQYFSGAPSPPRQQSVMPGVDNPPERPDYAVPPIARLTSTIDQFKGNQYQSPGGAWDAAVGFVKGIPRGIAQMTADIGDKAMKTATYGLINPRLGEAMRDNNRDSAVASKGTGADVAGEVAGPLLFGAPAAVRGLYNWRPRVFGNGMYTTRPDGIVPPGGSPSMQGRNFRVEQDPYYGGDTMYKAYSYPQDQQPLNMKAENLDPEYMGRVQMSPREWDTPNPRTTSEGSFTHPRWQTVKGTPENPDPLNRPNQGPFGVGSALYDEASMWHGNIQPDQSLMGPGQAFWMARDPGKLNIMLGEVGDDILNKARQQGVHPEDLSAQLQQYAKTYHHPDVQPLVDKHIERIRQTALDEGLLRPGYRPPKPEFSAEAGQGAPRPAIDEGQWEAMRQLVRDNPRPTGNPDIEHARQQLIAKEQRQAMQNAREPEPDDFKESQFPMEDDPEYRNWEAMRTEMRENRDRYMPPQQSKPSAEDIAAAHKLLQEFPTHDSPAMEAIRAQMRSLGHNYPIVNRDLAAMERQLRLEGVLGTHQRAARYDWARDILRDFHGYDIPPDESTPGVEHSPFRYTAEPPQAFTPVEGGSRPEEFGVPRVLWSSSQDVINRMNRRMTGQQPLNDRGLPPPRAPFPPGWPREFYETNLDIPPQVNMALARQQGYTPEMVRQMLDIEAGTKPVDPEFYHGVRQELMGLGYKNAENKATYESLLQYLQSGLPRR